MRSRFAWTGAAIAVVGAAVGLLFANIVSAPRGADHSCPAGSSVNDCTYPPDQTSWDVTWCVGGLVIGLVIGLSYVAARRARAKGKVAPW